MNPISLCLIAVIFFVACSSKAPQSENAAAAGTGPAAPLEPALPERVFVVLSTSGKPQVLDIYDGQMNRQLRYSKNGSVVDMLNAACDRLKRLDEARAEDLRLRSLEIHKQIDGIEDMVVNFHVKLPRASSEYLSDKENLMSNPLPAKFHYGVVIIKQILEVSGAKSDYRILKYWFELDSLSRATAIMHMAVQENLGVPEFLARSYTAKIMSINLEDMSLLDYKIFLNNILN